MVEQGSSWDDALVDVTSTRDILSTYLQRRPRAWTAEPPTKFVKGAGKGSQAPQQTEGGGKQKPKGKGRGQQFFKPDGKCHRFNRGECKEGSKCKFKHTCQSCGADGHGAHECRGSAQPAAQHQNSHTFPLSPYAALTYQPAPAQHQQQQQPAGLGYWQ